MPEGAGVTRSEAPKEYIPKTVVRRVTVNLLQFNAPERIIEREWFMSAGAFEDVVQ